MAEPAMTAKSSDRALSTPTAIAGGTAGSADRRRRAGRARLSSLAGEIGYLPSRADRSAERHGLARAIASFGLGPRRRDAWYADTITEARTLLSAAENGNRQALIAVAQAGRALGEAAMAITAVIDPEVLVLGGPVGIHPLLLAQVQDTLDQLAPAPAKVVASALGETAPLQGALELARRHARANI